MLAYFSHVMTKAEADDRLCQAALKAWAADIGLTLWDPAEHEQGLASMREFQAKDWNGMSECDFMLVAWTKNAPESRGVNAEIEWAVRLFHIPVLIVRSMGVPLEAWPFTTICEAPWWGFANTENQFKECITCLTQYFSQQRQRLAKLSRFVRGCSTTSRTPSRKSPASRRPATTSTIRASRSTGTSPSPKTRRTRSSVTYSSGDRAIPME